MSLLGFEVLFVVRSCSTPRTGHYCCSDLGVAGHQRLRIRLHVNKHPLDDQLNNSNNQGHPVNIICLIPLHDD